MSARLLVDGWHVLIGIETHAQIRASQKLFSRASTSHYTDPPNTHFNSVDAAFPGTLPRINPKCVLLAVRAALALNCDIHERSSFDRKHYFYPDLPSGYQITQHYSPFASGGYLKLSSLDKAVRVKQIQMEQDTAKSTVDPRTRTSNIDLNRAGAGLLEIVTEPDLHSPQEAAEYVRTLQGLLRTTGVSDCNMEAGSFRCDVNVSVNRPGEPPGTRCEIKNLNSLKFISAAIHDEITRQTSLLKASSPVVQETRAWDEFAWKTYKMRSKEDAPDYRYMPDSNLGTLHISLDLIHDVRRHLPLLPAENRERLTNIYVSQGVSQNDIDILLAYDAQNDLGFDGDEPSRIRPTAYFEALCANSRNPKVVANWIIHTLQGQLSASENHDAQYPPVKEMGVLIDLVESKIITQSSGKLLLKTFLSSPLRTMQDLAAEMQLTSQDPTRGDDHIRPHCLKAIEASPREVAAIRTGRINAVNKLIGHVLRETRGRADAQEAKTVLLDIIAKLPP